MNLDEVRRQSSRNLIETYFHLGMAVPGSKTISEDGFRACVGQFEHPICNFAADLNLDPWSVRKLSTMATDQPTFHVYALPGDEPPHLNEILFRSDFQVNYRLAMLSADSKPMGDCGDIIRATDMEHRRAITQFMTEQFFPRQTHEFRLRIAEATSSVLDFQLYEYASADGRMGALMLYENDHTIGLYNLCVSTMMRGLGIGRSMTRWAIDLANKRNKLITLQCDARLQTWYEEQGFEWFGTVDVYSLSNRHKGDIMKGT